jgi:hypothetical protein
MGTNSSPFTSRESPTYVGWRAELLAKLALSRLPHVAISEQPSPAVFDFSVTTEDNLVFFVEVKAFSSMRKRIREVQTISQLPWRIPNGLLERSHSEHRPVVLFLFDVDTEHGRYLRLDTLEIRANRTGIQTVRLPVENTINSESLLRMLEELRCSEKALRVNDNMKRITGEITAMIDQSLRQELSRERKKTLKAKLAGVRAEIGRLGAKRPVWPRVKKPLSFAGPAPKSASGASWTKGDRAHALLIEALKSAARPMTIRELTRAILRRGWKMPDKDPSKTVDVALRTSTKDFRQTAPGIFELVRKER